MTIQANQKHSYGKLAKLLHWGMALMLIPLMLIGSYMAGLELSDPSRLQLMTMHKSFGAVFMQLAVLRLIWSRLNPAPQLPNVLTTWERLLSRTVTVLLYVLMLAIPFSGFAMTNFYGYPVNFFGLVEFPQLFEKNLVLAGIAKQAHVTMVYTLLAALFLHIAGALKHRYFDEPEADVLTRMMPLKPRVQSAKQYTE
ncbi:cytochrome b [Pseudoalteromonas sp. T1lg75]|uniref:cytochrome b n=1 Tax=Pseudoalteromonas sp. T1lg75 TaxID=2077102 RepID=UPI000CF6246D|nr:cytochrome b [Pseudoalteromonas sp. T1lg75]